ncbi:MAG: hypothetical protein K2O91_24550 [Lachnospiraceae bacterium]|nr:hypothetical protein [Lachnospiraceae bacterium]
MLAGIRELQSSFYSSSEKEDSLTRVRIEGGGRKSITATQPGILEDLDRLVDQESYGNTENPLRWTTKSTRHLADELQKLGYKIQRDKVGGLL